ncbi:MAG TPA: sugar ABC transporter substrate-binding protein [Actinotalea sp.]
MHRSTTARRRATVVASGLVAALALAACSQGSATKSDDAAPASAGSSAAPVTVHYMNFSSNDGHEKDLAAIVSAFEAANTDVKVDVQTLPYADYFTALQTAVAGGTVADAFELNYENFVTYATNGALAELNGAKADAYKPSLLDAFAVDGKQYGLPESFSNVVLFYNADLFKAAGVETPTADWTWADEKAAADKLTNTAAGVWGDYQPVSFHEFYKALAQTGGEFFNADKTKATFASPEGIKAATWLVGKAGTSMPTEADGAGTPDFDSKLFHDGKLAMWHTGIWMFSANADAPFAWDIAVEPGDTQKASAMFTNGVAVSAKSEVAEAAQRWVEFLTSSDTTVTTRLATSWELPPVADETQLASYLDVKPPTNRQAVFDSLDAVVLPPVIESQQEMQDIVGEELSNAAAGRKTVEAALTDAQTRVDALLG